MKEVKSICQWCEKVLEGVVYSEDFCSKECYEEYDKYSEFPFEEEYYFGG